MTSPLVATSPAVPATETASGNPATVAAAPEAALREIRGVISDRKQLDDGRGHWVTGWDVTVSDATGSVTVRVPISVYNHRDLLGLRLGAALSVLGRVDADQGRVVALVVTGLVPPAKVAEHLAARDNSEPLAQLGW